MSIKKFSEFCLNEKRHFIYTRRFRLSDLIASGIYDTTLIDEWKVKYSLDDFAHCLFVSDNKPIGDGAFRNKIARYSKSDIKNKASFDDNSKDRSGYVPEDSELEVNGEFIRLFIFKKNSNETLRARQNHGFKYEANIRSLNGLEKLPYTAKWDAKGNMDRKFFEEKISLSKKVELWNGSSYVDLDWEDSSLEPFKSNMYWSIKSIANGKSVEMGDFKRISGLRKDGDRLVVSESKNTYFMFCVAFHDNGPGKNILSEYLILMSMQNWKKYLPDVESNIDILNDMYSELESHRLKGVREEELEKKWLEYRMKYSSLTDSNLVKLRFKRDTKGQLRIQSSIGYRNFMNIILKENRHIRIS